jgi:hypothetical protein
LTDTELLDVLGELGNGEGWIARHSTTGRGFRLHNISLESAARYGWQGMVCETPREAIEKFLKETGNDD